MDVIATEIVRADVRLYVSWDNWMGFDILSQSDAGDLIVRELASYFDARKDHDRYDGHFYDSQP